MTRVNLFQTPEHPCPYLADQISVTQFIDPERIPNKQLYSELSVHGFRRSGNHIYRPNCPNCHACMPIRVPVNSIKWSKSQKRIKNQGKQFTFNVKPAVSSDQHYDLYQRYITARHSDGDMYPPSRELYDNFLLCDWSESYYLNVFDEGKLIACAVFDKLIDGFSAVYSFFDPAYEKYSLGTLCIIKQIELLQSAQDWQYLYLGYQIDDCRKMNYKTNFKPYQIFQNDCWQLKA